MSDAQMNKGDRTRVYITVDVECAEERVIRGKLQPPQGYDVRVWGRFRNQPKDIGVGLIMRELEAHGMRGTFFVEALGSHYFGVDGLREVCAEMHARGHDVQLHTHPIQRRADFRSRHEDPAPDDIAAYSIETQAKLLREGVDILARCGIPRESLRAFRAGNFGASNDTWQAMKDAGLLLSSNYNPCYFDKNCRMRYPNSAPGLFKTDIGIWELPISNFKDERTHRFRHVQITAVSVDEMKNYLLQARRLGIGEVTVVTHSFELCHIDSISEKRGRINTVNARRLRGLCSFLRENRDHFEVDTCGALADRLSRNADARSQFVSGDAMPVTKPVHQLRRMAEQVYKRVEARVPVDVGAMLFT